MSGENKAVVLEREGALVTLTLNRPEVLNAYNRVMRDEIFEALEFVAATPEVRVLLVQGAGRAFGTGGDLSEFGMAASPLEARETRGRRDVWGLWSTLPCLTIASVHGLAVGGGFEMALLCDLLIAADTARFRLPETALGTIPGVGGTQTLPRAARVGAAASLLLAGREISGQEAGRLGLAQWVFPAGSLRRRAHSLASTLAARPAEVLEAAREVSRQAGGLSLDEGLRLEARLAKRLRQTKK
jgi:enoyl-CoA hydratase/carnithine racemase